MRKEGFKLNRYDHCVANKTINGKKYTICWYVDNTKISHVDPAVVTNVIESLESIFEKMTVIRGKRHKFIGMGFELTNDGKVKIIMKEYIKECIDTFGEDIRKLSSSPGGHYLFQVK